jgi:putative PIN family toxin of toxin-antitoxin system
MSARMRLVIDTNVWLAMLALQDPALAPLHDALAAQRCQAFSDGDCEAEFARVLAYERGKRTLDGESQAACLARFRELTRKPDGRASHPPMRLPDCRDRDDQKFLELARACGAHCLVTRDKALLEIGRRKVRRVPFDILTPTAFLRRA